MPFNSHYLILALYFIRSRAFSIFLQRFIQEMSSFPSTQIQKERLMSLKEHKYQLQSHKSAPLPSRSFQQAPTHFKQPHDTFSVPTMPPNFVNNTTHLQQNSMLMSNVQACYHSLQGRHEAAFS